MTLLRQHFIYASAAFACVVALSGGAYYFAPQVAPDFTIRHSPFYSHILIIHTRQKGEASFARFASEAPLHQRYLGRKLVNGDLETRRTIALMLSVTDFSIPEMSGPMTTALGDNDQLVRLRIAVALSLRGMRSAIPALMTAMDRASDPNEKRQLASCLIGLRGQ